MNPGRHRIFGFFEAQVDEYGVWFQDLDDVKAPALWDHAQAHGKRTISINLPGTYPAPPFNGVMISGFIAPDLARSVYPKMLLPYVEKAGYLLEDERHRITLLDQAQLRDPEHSREKGLKQFLDEKSYRPGYGHFKRKRASA